MRLTELEAKWLTPNLLALRCPHCREDWLTVKNAPISMKEQFDIYERAFGEQWQFQVVPCDPACSWNITGTLDNLTVTPSLDASKSGHWHGFITNGEVA